MDLSRHVETVRDGISHAAALADEHTQDVARRLGEAVESSARLALFGAITDATSEISAELAPGSIEVRVVDGNPSFAVHAPQPAGEPTVILPDRDDAEPAEPATETDEDEPMIRVSLRLPASVKKKVDEAADTEGISTNAWLVKAIQNALSPGRTTSSHQNLSGVGGVLGPNGPFGPNGIFGPGGLFGDGGVFGDTGSSRSPRPARPPRPPRPPRPTRTGNRVQGWVK